MRRIRQLLSRDKSTHRFADRVFFATASMKSSSDRSLRFDLAATLVACEGARDHGRDGGLQRARQVESQLHQRRDGFVRAEDAADGRPCAYSGPARTPAIKPTRHVPTPGNYSQDSFSLAP